MSYRKHLDEIFSGQPLRPLSESEGAALSGLRGFAVLYSNRSGSTLLTEKLYQAGVATPPQTEVWEPREVARTVAGKPGVTFTDYYLSTVLGWGEGGHCGFKFSAEQLEYLIDAGYLQAFADFRAVVISREDRIAQAVSLYFARVTDAWTSHLENEGARGDVPYDADAITAALDSVIAMEAANERFLALRGVPAFRVSHEGLSSTSDTTIRAVCQFLGCEWHPRGDDSLVPIAPQRSPLKTEYAQRYREQYALPQAP